MYCKRYQISKILENLQSCEEIFQNLLLQYHQIGLCKGTTTTPVSHIYTQLIITPQKMILIVLYYESQLVDLYVSALPVQNFCLRFFSLKQELLNMGHCNYIVNVNGNTGCPEKRGYPARCFVFVLHFNGQLTICILNF